MDRRLMTDFCHDEMEKKEKSFGCIPSCSLPLPSKRVCSNCKKKWTHKKLNGELVYTKGEPCVRITPGDPGPGRSRATQKTEHNLQDFTKKI